MITTVQQRLVHQGKTMSGNPDSRRPATQFSSFVWLPDGSTLSSYNLKEGSKVHLFTKKADEGKKLSQLDIALVNALKPHLAKEDIDRVVTEFHRELQAAFVNYSLDDIEKLAVNLLGWIIVPHWKHSLAYRAAKFIVIFRLCGRKGTTKNNQYMQISIFYRTVSIWNFQAIMRNICRYKSFTARSLRQPRGSPFLFASSNKRANH